MHRILPSRIIASSSSSSISHLLHPRSLLLSHSPSHSIHHRAIECTLNNRSRSPANESRIPKMEHIPTRMLIDGELRSQSSDRQTFASIAACNGETIIDVPQASVMDVDTAVNAAHRAFHARGPGSWHALTPRQRGALLMKLSQRIHECTHELATLESLCNGKTLAQSMMIDAPASASMFQYWAGWADKMENGRVIDIGTSHFNYTLHQPIGVCALIVPWNLPLIAAAAKIGPALCAGNTVILKPAEQTPLSSLRLAELIHEIGFPRGVVNIVTGDGRTGAALVEHPRVTKISFTGSTPIGQQVGARAALTSKRVSLELGGKNPVIVCKDADLDLAIESVHNGVFWNEGEACASGSRIFVHDDIYDEFVSRSIERARRRKVGHTFGSTEDSTIAQGSQVSEEQMNKILGYIESAKKEGAQLELGGYRMGEKGYYIAPTIFSQITDAMTVSREEIFGPVMCLGRFSEIDEVISRANATPFGLAAGVFTRDISIGNYITRQLHSGIVFWNCYHVVDVSAPFGGMKQSGMGREGGGMYGLEAYMEVKNVVQKV